MIEVELKFPVEDASQLRDRLAALGAKHESTQHHVDTYFNHPCRDFAETTEALRIRKIDGAAHVTYKGAKLPGNVKARRELEWSLGSMATDAHGDPDGTKMHELLTLLGFREVATVAKQRENYAIADTTGQFSVTIDRVDAVGTFAEVEVIADDERQVETSRERVVAMAESLGLIKSEPRSYLRLLLAGRGE